METIRFIYCSPDLYLFGFVLSLWHIKLIEGNFGTRNHFNYFIEETALFY